MIQVFPILILLTTMLIACQNPQQGPELPPMPEGPAQWVYYPSSEGPGAGKHIVFISGDEEYRSEEALPQLAKILSRQHGFACTVLFAQNPEEPGIIKPKYVKNIPGLEALRSADLMVMFTRFRELPDEQMQEIDDYLMKGGPVIGMRTATHAFNIKDTTSKWLHYDWRYKGEKAEWENGFGQLVLGETWQYHHGHHKQQSTRGLVSGTMQEHPLTNGLTDGNIWGPTDVYGVRLPMTGDTKVILFGQVMNRVDHFDEADALFGMKASDGDIAKVNPARPDAGNPNDPMMPIAWTRSYQLPGGQIGTSMCSTIGSSTDLLSEGVRRLYINAAYWLTGLEVPEKASVDLEGNYQPTAYSFMEDEYWEAKRLEVADYENP